MLRSILLKENINPEHIVALLNADAVIPFLLEKI